MANGTLLRQLIRSGAEGDVEAFRGTAKAVIAEERQKQHHLLANDLDTILYGRPRSPAPPAVRKLTGDIPQDRERGLPLLAVREPVRGLADIVLSPANRSLVEELLREHNRAEVLQAHGLRPSDRVLLCGPPGCGKTLTAEVTRIRTRSAAGDRAHGQRGFFVSRRNRGEPAQGVRLHCRWPVLHACGIVTYP